MSEDNFKILSVDGGGIRGLIPCVFLVEIENMLQSKYGQKLTEYFDMVAGTSTGSIIAAGIAAGLPVEKMLDLYFLRGRDIFPYRSRWDPRRIGLLLQHGISAPKYDLEDLEEVLKDELGDKKVGEIEDIKLLIPFYDTIKRNTEFFKSYPDRRNDIPKFKDVPVWEAALCSSAAPTFFSAHLLKANDVQYSAIDGGVAANNPVACAMADALSDIEDLKKIKIVSLGTGASTRIIEYDDAKEWGAAEWAIPIIDVLMDGALDVYRYIAQTLVGNHNMLRLQFNLNGEDFGVGRLNDDMDDASKDNLENLRKAARIYFEQQANKVREFL